MGHWLHHPRDASTNPRQASATTAAAAVSRTGTSKQLPTSNQLRPSMAFRLEAPQRQQRRADQAQPRHLGTTSLPSNSLSLASPAPRATSVSTGARSKVASRLRLCHSHNSSNSNKPPPSTTSSSIKSSTRLWLQPSCLLKARVEHPPFKRVLAPRLSPHAVPAQDTAADAYSASSLQESPPSSHVASDHRPPATSSRHPGPNSALTKFPGHGGWEPHAPVCLG